MIDPPLLEKDILDNEDNRQNFLSLIDRVIFSKMAYRNHFSN